MVPYIYTEARRAYDTGIAFVHPLFYEYPDISEAMDSRDNEYIFGSQILVAPVTEAVNIWTQLATKTIWLPEGTWIEWFSGDAFVGPTTISRTYALTEMPVFVKAGSVRIVLTKW